MEMGIKIVAATDSTYEGDRPVAADEIIALVGIGIPPMEAIKAEFGFRRVPRRWERIGTSSQEWWRILSRLTQPVGGYRSAPNLVLVVHDGKVIVNRLDP